MRVSEINKYNTIEKYITSVITLTLLHPIQSLPVQSWTFESESVIRIGRSTNNDVVLYSAVVSRRHVEVKRNQTGSWEVLNLGANGTYIDGKRINKTAVVDGMIIRLASSGPKIQINLQSAEDSSLDRGGAAKRQKSRGLKDETKDTLIS